MIKQYVFVAFEDFCFSSSVTYFCGNFCFFTFVTNVGGYPFLDVVFSQPLYMLCLLCLTSHIHYFVFGFWYEQLLNHINFILYSCFVMNIYLIMPNVWAELAFVFKRIFIILFEDLLNCLPINYLRFCDYDKGYDGLKVKGLSRRTLLVVMRLSWEKKNKGRGPLPMLKLYHCGFRNLFNSKLNHAFAWWWVENKRRGLHSECECLPRILPIFAFQLASHNYYFYVFCIWSNLQSDLFKVSAKFSIYHHCITIFPLIC